MTKASDSKTNQQPIETEIIGGKISEPVAYHSPATVEARITKTSDSNTQHTFARGFSIMGFAVGTQLGCNVSGNGTDALVTFSFGSFVQLRR